MIGRELEQSLLAQNRRPMPIATAAFREHGPTIVIADLSELLESP
jgi:hypothetical protein